MTIGWNLQMTFTLWSWYLPHPGLIMHVINASGMCLLSKLLFQKVYQLLAHGRWFSPGTPASSTTKTVRHDIAEILLKVALNTKKTIKLINLMKPIILCSCDNILLTSIFVFSLFLLASCWTLCLYNYLWVQILLMERCTRYNIMW